MRTSRLIVIAGLALFGLSNQASADTFTFSFTNLGNGGDTVTGTVILNATDTAATSVTVDTNSATPTFGIGQYVVSGQITVADFGDQHEIQEIIMTLHADEKIDFLDEIQQPRHVH